VRERERPYVLSNDLVSGLTEVDVDEIREERHGFFERREKELGRDLVGGRDTGEGFSVGSLNRGG
jgi:hypothetical protein